MNKPLVARRYFPEMKDFSSRSLKYMKVFARTCPDLQIGQQNAAQLPCTDFTAQILKDPYHFGAIGEIKVKLAGGSNG